MIFRYCRTSSFVIFEIVAFLMLSLGVILFGCKREDDALPPAVEFVSPSENAIFAVGDTIKVIADIQSDIPLTRIALSLISPEGIQVQHTEELLPSMQLGRVQSAYPLYDTSLRSGAYRLMILAEHKTDTKKKFRTIQIEGIPREWKGMVVLTRQSFDRTRILMIQPDLSTSVLDTLHGDHLSSVILYPQGVLVQTGKITGGISAYDLNSQKIIWQVAPTPNPPFPTYSNLSVWSGMAFVGLYEGRIRVFQASGKEQLAMNLPGMRIPGCMMLHAGKIFIDEQIRTGYDRYLGVYHYPSTAVYHVYYPGIETLALLPFSSDEIFWLGNDNGQGVLRIYYPSQGGYWTPLTLPTGRLKAACAGPPGHIFLSTSNGILWYRKDLNSLSTLQASLSPHWLSFEEINSVLLAAKGSQLSLISFPSGQIATQLNLNDSIFEAHPYYNW